MRVFAALCAATLLVACSQKPSDQDIRAVLTDNLPQGLKTVSAVDQVQAETSGGAEDSSVKFKAVLKTAEPLYAAVPFDEARTSVGANTNVAAQIDSAAHQLSPDTRAKFKADIDKATAKPAFIKVVTPSGTASEWYGAFKTRKVVDKWLPSDFKTESEPKLTGQPKASFPADAIDISTAKQWFADMQPKQEALLQRLADAKSLEQKDAELAQQQAMAQQEREAKEALIAAQEKQARRLPLQAVGFRPAALGGTFVLRVEAQRPMTLHVEVMRGAQHFARDLNLTPGRVVELGHLEGWGFKSGDQVSLSNASFDTASFVVR